MAKLIKENKSEYDINAIDSATNLDEIGKLFVKLFSPLEEVQLGAYTELRSTGIFPEDVDQSVDSFIRHQHAIMELFKNSSSQQPLISAEGALGGIPFHSSPVERLYRGHAPQSESYEIILHKKIEIVKSIYDSNRLKLGQGSQVPSLDDKVKEVQALPSEDFEGRLKAAVGLTAAARSVMAAELAPALNARIKAMPQETLDQKKELARWVNDQLEPLGLAIREPKSGLPGKLRGMTGHWPDVGRFAIEVKFNDKQKTPTVSDTLPELTLTDAAPRQEPEVDWQQAVGPKERRTGPRR